MKTIWVVHQDSHLDNTILGVFDVEDEAYEYLDQVGGDYPNGALLTPYPIPWRRTDRSTQIRLN